ncbi:MAG: hemolysin III family protein [Actinomycetota bacterium]
MTMDEIRDRVGEGVRHGVEQARHAEAELVANVRKGLSRAERDLSDGLQRWRLYRMNHPVRGLMDAGAAITFLGLFAWLLSKARPWATQIPLVVYGISVVGLFVVSSLYHSVPWRPVWRGRMRRLDHTMIFVLVAGTYTPVAVLVLDGWVRVATLAAVWSITAVGGFQKFVMHTGNRLSISLQVLQGWMALLLLGPLLARLPVQAVALIVGGGLLYTIGMVALVTRRPFLWPRFFSYHEVFHVFVIAAATLHFVMIARYVAVPAA